MEIPKPKLTPEQIKEVQEIKEKSIKDNKIITK